MAMYPYWMGVDTGGRPRFLKPCASRAGDWWQPASGEYTVVPGREYTMVPGCEYTMVAHESPVPVFAQPNQRGKR